MKRTSQIILILCSFLVELSVRAEHQTYLRGIVNLPGFQVALLEIQHTLVKSTNAPPVIITTSELARARVQFEDQTIKGGHFQFEVLVIDFSTETVKTREAGEEHIYSLANGSHSAKAGNRFRLENAAFKDVIDLYSKLGGRTVLLHPAVERGVVSLEAEWTNQVPEKAEITHAFEKYFKQRGASTIFDGEKFVQLVPSNLSQTGLPRSTALPTGAAVAGGILLENVGLDDVVKMYANFSGRRHVGEKTYAGFIPYFNLTQNLSKPEVLYVLETFCIWNGWRIVLGDDNTFSLEHVERRPSGLR